MTSTAQRRPSDQRDPQTATRRAVAMRDAALRRLRSATRWIGVGSVVAIGVLTIYVSRVFPGHTTAGSGAGVSSARTTTGSNGTTGTTGTATTLTPSTLSPSSTGSSPGVVSGAS